MQLSRIVRGSGRTLTASALAFATVLAAHGQSAPSFSLGQGYVLTEEYAPSFKIEPAAQRRARSSNAQSINQQVS